MSVHAIAVEVNLTDQHSSAQTNAYKYFYFYKLHVFPFVLVKYNSLNKWANTMLPGDKKNPTDLQISVPQKQTGKLD